MKRHNGILFALRYIFTGFPRYFAATLLYHIGMECGSAVHNVWVYYLVINVLSSGQPPERLILIIIGLVIYAAVTGRYFAWYDEKFRPMQENHLSCAIKTEILERAAHIEMEAYDDPAFYNETMLNLESAHEKLPEILHLSMQILGSAAAILLSLAAYVKIGMAYFCVLLIFVAVSILISRKIALGQFERKKRMVIWERKREYFSELLTRRSSAQDLRLTHVSRVFFRHYEDAASHMKQVIKKDGKPLAAMGFLQSCVIERLILNFGTLAWLSYAAMVTRTIGLTEFVTAFKGVNTVADALNQIFDRYVVRLHEYNLFADSFQSFVTAHGCEGERDEAREISASPSVYLDHIVFRYPGCCDNVLDRLSLWIPQGKRVAIVGPNGAGKTTLVKLLMGLYQPQEGSIFLNGEKADMRLLKEYGRQSGVLFQQYNLYACSVAQNIAMDLDCDPTEAELSLGRSGFQDYGPPLPDGIQTEVTKEFDERGLQMSGGQQQLLASTRLYYRKKPFFILDEPSAALDPRMEGEMIRRIWELTEGITTVIISHRLSMTKNADIIYYLENGKIVENGTHESLCARKGKYAALWKTQVDKYTHDS